MTTSKRNPGGKLILRIHLLLASVEERKYNKMLPAFSDQWVDSGALCRATEDDRVPRGNCEVKTPFWTPVSQVVQSYSMYLTPGKGHRSVEVPWDRQGVEKGWIENETWGQPGI